VEARIGEKMRISKDFSPRKAKMSATKPSNSAQMRKTCAIGGSLFEGFELGHEGGKEGGKPIDVGRITNVGEIRGSTVGLLQRGKL